MSSELPAHVLVIDDDEYVHKVFRFQLSRLGCHQITGRLSAHEGLEFLASAKGAVDRILLDLNMPGIDGVALLRLLASSGYQGAVALASGEPRRVLELTRSLARAHALRVIGALQKPLKISDVEGLLAAWRDDLRSTRQSLDVPDFDRAELFDDIENGRLRLVYQPKICLQSGRVAGFEALARWTSRTAGPVSPDRFVAAAEAGGMIDKLTDVVVRHAIAQTGAWHRAGHPINVAVNVSMLNLNSLTLPDRLAELLRNEHLAGQCLTLEVTETQLMGDVPAAMEALLRLRLMRCGVAIDDFGTGYTSLTQLHDLPLTELKVDRRFVRAQGAEERAILESSIALGKKIGLTVTVEGVEDHEDLERVRLLGADAAQGYLFSKPIAADGVIHWTQTTDLAPLLVREPTAGASGDHAMVAVQGAG